MLKQLIAIFCFLVLFVLALIYFFQRHLLYFPSRQTPQTVAYKALDMKVISLESTDNILLKSWYKKAKKNKPTVLYLHGNSGHIGYRMPIARQLINAGFGVLLLEYRGYGGNRGSPSEQGFYNDARAGLEFLTKNKVTDDNLVIFGESLGTGVATKMAEEHRACALILQSPFTSITDLARYHYPWLLFKPWDNYNSLGRIRQINTPLLVIHGQKDLIVPYQNGLTLFNAANKPKNMLSLPNHKHNNIWSATEVYGTIISFIKQHC